MFGVIFIDVNFRCDVRLFALSEKKIETVTVFNIFNFIIRSWFTNVGFIKFIFSLKRFN